MDLDLPQGKGRVVPQAKSGGGGFLAQLGAMVTGAYTQTLRGQNQLAMEYQREIIRSAGDKTRHDNRFEFQQNVLNDQQRRREDGSPIEQAFGVRYTSAHGKGKPKPDANTPGTPRKGGKGGKGGKNPTPGKMKEVGIGEAEEALKLSKGVGGRKPTKKQKLSDTYEITDTTTGKSRTVKDPAKNLGIDQETVADSSPRYAAKLGRKAAAKAVKNNPNPNDGGNGNKK
jgi:hypothetical protein